MNRAIYVLLLVIGCLGQPLCAFAQDRLPGTQKLTDTRSIATAPAVTPSPSVFGGLTQKSFAEPPFLKLPAIISAEQGLIVVPADTNCEGVAWLSVDKRLQLVPPHLLKDSKTGLFVGMKDGVYQVYAVTASADGKLTPFVTTTVTIGTPPDPTPPVPPGPLPPVPPTPIPVEGFRVLVIYESSVANNTAKIVAAAAVRDYLNAKCSKGSDGKSPDWRVLDKDTNMINAAKVFQDMMALPRTTVPWIVVAAGKTGYSGPLPATVDETLALLKKFGG